MDYVRSGCFSGLVCLVCFFRLSGLGNSLTCFFRGEVGG